VGLFSGVTCACTFHPAEPGSGIRFRRGDLPGSPAIAGAIASICSDPSALGLPLPKPARCTILAAGSAFVLTVEHAMSALAGLGVTDAMVDVSGPEVPGLDGSAQPFVEALQRVGFMDRPEGGPDPLVIRREIVVGDERSGVVVARPRSQAGCRYCYELDYGANAPLAAQQASWATGQDYVHEVAPARTFALAQEAAAMKAAGLFRHLSARDMLVIGPEGPIENAYRFPDEPARHKLLDLIGDLALVGRPIQGEIVGRRSGHHVNHALASALASGS
jgi:UDP-3-O-acyl-N-acetylglucosamine deacetylase